MKTLKELGETPPGHETGKAAEQREEQSYKED